MTLTLRIILIICSIMAFLLCITRIKQSKLKLTNSVIWMIGSILLILMSIFFNVIEWISIQLGFMAPVNFVFFIIIVFLLIQGFVDNIRICVLSEKIKELNHYLALKDSKKIKGEKSENE